MALTHSPSGREHEGNYSFADHRGARRSAATLPEQRCIRGELVGEPREVHEQGNYRPIWWQPRWKSWDGSIEKNVEGTIVRQMINSGHVKTGGDQTNSRRTGIHT